MNFTGKAACIAILIGLCSMLTSLTGFAAEESPGTAFEVLSDTVPMLIMGKSKSTVETDTTPDTTQVVAKKYLPDQPILLNFADGGILTPYSQLRWSKIYVKTTGAEAKYSVVVLDMTTKEAQAYLHLTAK